MHDFNADDPAATAELLFNEFGLSPDFRR